MSTNPIKYSDLVQPDNSINDLIAQLETLQKTHADTLSKIKGEALELSKALDKVTGATEAGRNATKKAVKETDRLEKAEKELKFAQSETAQKINELNSAKQEANRISKLTIKVNQSAEGSYNRLSAQYSLNKIRLNQMSQAEREQSASARKLESDTKNLYEQMKKLQEATGKHQLNVGNYTEASDAIIAYADNIKSALGVNNKFGESLLALGRGGAESKAVFSAMGDGVKALGKTLLGLMTNPVFLAIAGIAGAGVAFKWWYDYNAGLVEATRLTQQFTGKEGESLKNYRNEVQAVADTFGKDFKETIIASNSLSKQFGISADEALKLIKDGFIAGADVNGEFLDSVKEYPAYFKEAGISADAFIAIIAQTNKAGIFSDKGIDAIKEANLRLREMTKGTADALEGIGINSAQVQEDLQSGAKTTFDIMQEVSAKLNELPESSAVVGTAIADIFGGPGEDAGLQYLKTLKDISTNLDETKDKAGKLGKLQEEQLQSQIELENNLSALFDFTGGTFEELTTKAKVFLNKGLSALIRGVIDLANYFIELYNESLPIRYIWSTISVTFKNALAVIVNGFKSVVDIIKGFGNIIKGVFTFDWDSFKEGIDQFRMAIPNAMKATMKDVAKNVNDGISNINKKVKKIEIPVSVGGADMGAKNQASPVRKNVGKVASGGGKSVTEKAKQQFDEIDALLDAQDQKATRLAIHFKKLEKDKVDEAIKQTTRLVNEVSAEQRKMPLFNEEDKEQDIFDLLGLNIDEEKKSAILQTIDTAKTALSDFINLRMQMAEQAVENADKEVDSAQRVLEAEMTARANGYANNVEMAQKELDLAKKNQQKALNEQKKAQKAQIALESAEQIVNLVTATSGIWKSFAGVGPWGIPAALSAIALMWGSFAASKIKAVQLVNKSEQYGEGTVELLQGGSHQSHNDIDLGTKRNGTKRRAEGGEYFAVINKRNSRKFRKLIPDVINSLNNGSFTQKYMGAFDGANGLTLNIAGTSPDLKNLSNDVREIKEQNQRKVYTDAKGRTIVEYKNLTQKIN